MRDAIAGVVNQETVYNRLRYASKWDEYLAKFTATLTGRRLINGWWVERERIVDTYHSFGKVDRAQTFVSRGIMGFKDELDTDGLFGDQVDTVMDALTGVQVTGAWEVGPSVVRVLDLRSFGSVLCHYAEIENVAHVEVTL